MFIIIPLAYMLLQILMKDKSLLYESSLYTFHKVIVILELLTLKLGFSVKVMFKCILNLLLYVDINVFV